MKKIITIFTFTIILSCYFYTSYADDSYYPLASGYSWTYDFITKNHLGQNRSWKLNVENLGPTVIKDKKLYPRKIFIGSWTNFSFVGVDERGIYQYAYQKTFDVEPKIIQGYILKNPIKIGTTWESPHTTTLLEKQIKLIVTKKIVSIDDKIVVPAGEFSKCIHIKKYGKTTHKESYVEAEILVDEDIWFAPDVGFIKSIRKEKSNNLLIGYGESVQQLETFSNN